jgi:hypothetical protein
MSACLLVAGGGDAAAPQFLALGLGWDLPLSTTTPQPGRARARQFYAGDKSGVSVMPVRLHFFLLAVVVGLL